MNFKFKSIIIKFITIFLIQSANGQTKIGNLLMGEEEAGYFGTCVSMPDAKTIAVNEILRSVNNIYQAGAVKVHRLEGSTWKQKGNDIHGEIEEGSFGRLIYMPDSNTIAIGAWNSSKVELGFIRILKWDGKNWIKKGQDFKSKNSDNLIGNALYMPDSNTIVIKDMNIANSYNIFSIRVYTWDGINWVQKGLSIEYKCIDRGGWSNSVKMPDANTLAVVIYQSISLYMLSTQTNIYKWDGGEWQLNEEIKHSDTNTSTAYIEMPNPRMIAISLHCATSDSGKICAGRVNIYNKFNNTWLKTAEIKNNIENEMYFGHSISMPDSSTIAITSNVDSAGYIIKTKLRIFRYINSNWKQSCEDIVIPGIIYSQDLASPISMPDKNTLAIGMFLSLYGKGSAQVYNVNCSEVSNNGGLDDCKIHYPNSFTPNNDGKNDTFNLVSLCKFSFYRLRIYNFWGEKLFDNTNPKAGWNGEYNSKQTPSGKYVAIFDLIKSGTNEKIKYKAVIFK